MNDIRALVANDHAYLTDFGVSKYTSGETTESGLVGTLDYGPVRVVMATMGYKHVTLDPAAVAPAPHGDLGHRHHAASRAQPGAKFGSSGTLTAARIITANASCEGKRRMLSAR